MKSMVSGTIKNQMEAKDGNWYENVREIYAEVRLVFTNAMKYNDDQSDVHVMAKSLLEKFEEKWLQLRFEVAEEVELSNSYFFSHLLYIFQSNICLPFSSWILVSVNSIKFVIISFCYLFSFSPGLLARKQGKKMRKLKPLQICGILERLLIQK